MILPDVNILVYAFRADASKHAAYRAWLESAVNGVAPFGIASIVLSGFLRLVTHPRVFRDPAPMDEAQRFVSVLRERPNCVHVEPGARHWEIFEQLVRETGARGNAVPDAYLAALAIESGSEWITADRGFARYRGLKWRDPL